MKFLTFASSILFLLSSFAQASCMEDIFETMVSKTSLESSKNPAADVIKQTHSEAVFLHNKTMGASLRTNISKKGEHVIIITSDRFGGVAYQFLFDASCKLIINQNKDPSSYTWMNAAAGTSFSSQGQIFPFTTIDKCYEDADRHIDFPFFCELLEDKNLKSIFDKGTPVEFTKKREKAKASQQ